MKLAVLSDVHGNNTAFQAALQDLAARQIINTIFLGDIVMTGPEPGEALSSMKELAPLCWIKGNTDMWLEEVSKGWKPSKENERRFYDCSKYAMAYISSEDIQFIRKLPDKKLITIEGIRLLCIHGSPHSPNEIVDPAVEDSLMDELIGETDADIILCGHSHSAFIRKYREKYIINPGSIGISIDGKGTASYAVLDTATVEMEIVRVPYPVDWAIETAVKRGLPYLERFKNLLK